MELFFGLAITACLLFGFFSTIYIMAVERHNEKLREETRLQIEAMQSAIEESLKEDREQRVNQAVSDFIDAAMEFKHWEEDTQDDFTYEEAEDKNGPTLRFSIKRDPHVPPGRCNPTGEGGNW